MNANTITPNRLILVTGGAGFIGANLIRRLLGHGYTVRVLDNLSHGNLSYLDGLSIQFMHGDILDRSVVAEAVQGCTAVIHLAAQTGVPGSVQDPVADCEVNILGTLYMLEACRQQGVERFVFASSNAPLGRTPPPATEDKAPLPISPYGASKLAGEGYCLAYHGSWGLKTVVLRFANLYGPYSAHKNSVVSQFFKDIHQQGQVIIDGDGLQTRDFIYVGDLCRVVEKTLESEISGEVFQIATGIETSIRQLADLVQQVTQRSFHIAHGPARRGDIRKNYSRIAKVKTMLGWEPQMALEEGLRRTWAWYQSYFATQTASDDSLSR